MHHISGISIVIPVLNERKNLEKLIPTIYKIIKIKKFELIIVDDHSNDGTNIFINKFNKSRRNKIKHLIRKAKNKDLSKSCVLGFNKSKYKYILVMDGDGQHNPIYINKMYKIMISRDIDILVAVRDLFSSRINGLNFLRVNMSRTITLIINGLFGFKTIDPMSGFFLFKKNIFLKNKKKLFNQGYKILFDLITSDKSLKIDDIKINFLIRKKGSSKLDLNIIKILLKHIIYKIIYKFSFIK